MNGSRSRDIIAIIAGLAMVGAGIGYWIGGDEVWQRLAVERLEASLVAWQPAQVIAAPVEAKMTTGTRTEAGHLVHTELGWIPDSRLGDLMQRVRGEGQTRPTKTLDEWIAQANKQIATVDGEVWWHSDSEYEWVRGMICFIGAILGALTGWWIVEWTARKRRRAAWD